MKKFTKEQIETLIKYWGRIDNAGDNYWAEIGKIEAEINNETGIDIEIFHVDGEPVGFGDIMREYGLLQRNHKDKWIQDIDE